jgi:hypothetical protein
MNKRKQNRRKSLTQFSEEQPKDRMSEFERRLRELETDVAMLKNVSVLPVFPEEISVFPDEVGVAEKKKRGIKEKISDEVLFQYRDSLVIWLEPVWPWLQDRLLQARTGEQVGAVLEAVSKEPDLRPEWQKRLLQNGAALYEFLWDERFRKTLPKTTVTNALTLLWEDERRQRAANQFPSRQIANAMAGVPDISWRRSLDRCFAQPSLAFVAVSMDMFYRDGCGIPMPKDRDLTGESCPVPKLLQPVLARPSDDTKK